jgi:FAD/FMN-containing dehydrogenase
MNDAAAQPLRFHPPRAESELARRLRGAVAGDVLFDSTSRGRYATDASIYQVEPIGVLVPQSVEDVRTAIAICREQNVPMLPRGAGSSQCGQTVGAALVIDHSKHLNRIGRFDPDAMTVDVEPGVVLDQLNTHLKPQGLWFPVDVSTSAQATLGGMAGKLVRSRLAYGAQRARDRRHLSDGTEAHFAPEPR